MKNYKISRKNLYFLFEQRIFGKDSTTYQKYHSKKKLNMGWVFQWLKEFETVILESNRDIYPAKTTDQTSQDANHKVRKRVKNNFLEILQELNTYHYFNFPLLNSTKIMLADSTDTVDKNYTTTRYLQEFAKEKNLRNFYDPDCNYPSLDCSEYLLSYIEKTARNGKGFQEFLTLTNDEVIAQDDFNALLTAHQALYVFCIDIEFNKPDSFNSNNFILKIISVLPDITSSLVSVSELILRLHTVLLPIGLSGLSLHCIFTLKTKKINEESFMASIQRSMPFLTLPIDIDVKIINWNEVLRKLRKSSVIGTITSKNQEDVRGCQEFVISAAYSFDQFIGFNQKVLQSHLGNNPVQTKPMSHPILPYNTLSLDHDTSASIDQSKEQPTLESTDVPSLKNLNYLPKSRLQYLKTFQLYQPEFEVTNTQNTDIIRDWFYNIELLMETLAYSEVEIFHFPKGKPTSKLTKYLTRVGILWFRIARDFALIKESIVQSSYPKIKTSNFKLFNSVFKEIPIVITFEMLIQSGVEFDKFVEAITTTLRQLKANLPSAKINSALYSRLDGRYNDHRSYFANVIKGEKIVYRLELKCNEYISLKDKEKFAKIFASLIRIGKQASPLKWLSGYIIRWDINMDNPNAQFLYGDLVLVFKRDEQNIELDLFKKLKEYLVENKTKGKHEEFKHIQLNQKKIWHSVPSLAVEKLVLEQQSTAIRKVLLDEYLLVFEFLDVFKLADNIPKRVTTGSLPKAEKDNSKSGQDSQKNDNVMDDKATTSPQIC